MQKEVKEMLAQIIVLLLLLKRSCTAEEKVKQWKPRDFYLVYKMWTDEEYRNVNGK